MSDRIDRRFAPLKFSMIIFCQEKEIEGTNEWTAQANALLVIGRPDE